MEEPIPNDLFMECWCMIQSIVSSIGMRGIRDVDGPRT